jgi:hypothetical protein
MSHKLGICIPYRNRKNHLEQLIPKLSEHLDKQGIEYKFYVGHQVDNNLFNRGAMKNVAAHYAFKDGCDYIAWHDVDMIPHDESDYSYPDENPMHIATKLSKYQYGLGYDQYFGGVVLFNKEQVDRTNGYSNDYWDWGQEDDDLFWRCYFEGYTTGKVYKKYENKEVANFNGTDSFLTIPTNREISSCLHNDHTISILFSAEQQPEKVPIWLVGDENKKFIEYPLIRKDGSWTWGLSFNNSRAVTMAVFDKNNIHHYNYAKRFENQWTWVTLSYSRENNQIYYYLNNELVSQVNGTKKNLPIHMEQPLKNHDAVRPFLIGFCNHSNTYYKGKIADVRIYNTFFDNIENVYENESDLVLRWPNFSHCGNNNVDLTTEDIEVVENILPFRRDSRFDCLPHLDEGFVHGKWAKGETTARNEKRFVTEMQQGKINYKNDGIKQIKDLLHIVKVNNDEYPNTCFIDCTTNPE